MHEVFDPIEILSGDKTPEVKPVRCVVNGWDDTTGSWSIDALTSNGLLRFTSSKRASITTVKEVKDILQGNHGLQHPGRLVGIRKGALFMSRDHFDDLVCGFVEFQQAIDDAKSQAPECPLKERLEQVYEKYFLGECFKFGKAKQRPKFDDETYPSLFEELPLLRQGRGVPAVDLPTEWTPASLAKNPKLQDPLVALLLGFIWKQGDFLKVTHVLHGLLNSARQPSDSVVLYQFGRHLSNPTGEPIFDQHSARAQWLLSSNIGEWESADALSAHLKGDGRNYVLFGESRGSLNQFHLDRYRDWWTKSIVPVLPMEVPDRLSIAQLVDRLLFSLGKAAVFILRPE